MLEVVPLNTLVQTELDDSYTKLLFRLICPTSWQQKGAALIQPCQCARTASAVHILHLYKNWRALVKLQVGNLVLRGCRGYKERGRKGDRSSFNRLVMFDMLPQPYPLPPSQSPLFDSVLSMESVLSMGWLWQFESLLSLPKYIEYCTPINTIHTAL